MREAIHVCNLTGRRVVSRDTLSPYHYVDNDPVKLVYLMPKDVFDELNNHETQGCSLDDAIRKRFVNTMRGVGIERLEVGLYRIGIYLFVVFLNIQV